MNCQEKNCDSAVAAREWCWKHYRRWLRNGDPQKTNAPWDKRKSLEKDAASIVGRYEKLESEQ